MKRYLPLIGMLLIASSVCAEIQIDAIRSNGELSFTTASTEGTVKIEWASSATGTWHDSWQWLNNLPISDTNMTVQVPMFFRVAQSAFSPISNTLAAIQYDPTDKSTYLSDTGLYQNGYGTYQKGGPEYTYYMSNFEISNAEFVEFLNDAQTNTASERGAYMYFHSNGNVYMATNMTAEERMFTEGGSRILYSTILPAGQRYYVDPSTPIGGGSYADHPVISVSWYGAVKYCNWLTIVTGRGPEQRCYSEGSNPSNWGPVTATLWANGYFSISERIEWLNYRGFRLPMDRAVNINAFNEYYKAAAWNSLTNTEYAFGRDMYDIQDLNYNNSQDFFEGDIPECTPVGWYDGSLHEYYGNTFQTRINQNYYGIYDLAGNVREWSNDFFSEGNPSTRIIRGGSWNNSSVRNDDTPVSSAPYYADTITGFRIVTTFR